MDHRPALLSWLWRRYLRQHWPWLLVAFAFMAAEGSMLGVLSWIVGPLFDDVLVGGSFAALTWVGAIILGIFLTRAVSSVVQRVLLTRVAQLTSARIRGDLLAHLMTLDAGFHQINPPGTLIERVQGDVEALGKVWTGVITGLGRDAVSVLALFTVALMVDWKWTLVALIGIPVLVAPALFAQTYVRKRARKARAVAAQMSVRLDEVFHGIAPIKLNRLEEAQSRRYGALMDARVDAEVKSAFGQSMIPAMVDVMAGLGFVGVLFYGGAQIIDGERSVGEFMSFFTAMALTFEPLRRLGNLSGLWQAAAASVERIFDLFAEKATLSLPAKPVPAPTGAPEITFADVHLSYGDTPVLRGLSFRAAAGQTTALVGASGAGKSTIFNVLTRLVEPESGQVQVGGIGVAEIALDELRGLFSVVSQDAALFDESLRENILLGTEADDAAMSRALETAFVTDFIDTLPQGLDSPAGPRGSALSGGQRQRIAIARAVLRDTPVLLLDEATSALDTKSEARVQAALDRLSEGRTTLVIAHRLSTVQGADKIVVMDRGRVVDEGTHDELLARGGHYAELHAMQFRATGGGAVPRPAEPTPRRGNWISRLFGRGPLG